MPLWRNRCNIPLRSPRRSSMFFSGAICRQAAHVLDCQRFSARLRSEKKKYSRMNARNFLVLPPWRWYLQPGSPYPTGQSRSVQFCSYGKLRASLPSQSLPRRTSLRDHALRGNRIAPAVHWPLGYLRLHHHVSTSRGQRSRTPQHPSVVEGVTPSHD